MANLLGARNYIKTSSAILLHHNHASRGQGRLRHSLEADKFVENNRNRISLLVFEMQPWTIEMPKHDFQ